MLKSNRFSSYLLHKQVIHFLNYKNPLTYLHEHSFIHSYYLFVLRRNRLKCDKHLNYICKKKQRDFGWEKKRWEDEKEKGTERLITLRKLMNDYNKLLKKKTTTITTNSNNNNKCCKNRWNFKKIELYELMD